jgi:ABC-type dipeptide/oligopeptide/nickel transport system permease subunit
MKETFVRSIATTFRSHPKLAYASCSLLLFLCVGLFAPLLAPYHSDTIFIGKTKLSPLFTSTGSFAHPLGTDDLGRDTLSRLIYGARVSLTAGLAVVLISAITGTLLGLIAGYYGGFIDRLILRFTDFILSLPSLLLAIVIMSVLGPGLDRAMLAVSLISLPHFVRVVRSQAMVEMQKSYIHASLTFAPSSWFVMFKHLLPNCMAPLLVQMSLGLSDAILNIAALGFLGLGAKAPTPEWGMMLADARGFMTSSPWMSIFPGMSIFFVVLSFNLFGDALRDLLDPKLKGKMP